MRTSHFLNFFSLISTTYSLLKLVNAVTYGPSLVSLTRWDRLSRGPTIFNPDTGRIISLADYPNYSVVIPLAPENPSASSNQVFISRRVSGPGEFHVEAPPGYGVMAVIQSLDLRVADASCNDFILFSELDGGGVETTGTCGKVDIRDGSYAPQGLVGPRAFISPSGRMRVLFYHGFIWGLVRNFNFDLLDPSLNPTLRLEIAFTAFKDCPSTNFTSSSELQHQPSQKNSNFENSPETSEHNESEFSLVSCSSALNSKCIRKELLCDRTINCAFEENFGSDEDVVGCPQEHSSLPTSKARKSAHSTTSTIPTTTERTTTTTSRITTSLTTPKTEPRISTTTAVHPGARINKIESTTEREVKNNSNNRLSGTDAVGLIGLVRKFPRVEIKSRAEVSSSTIKPSINRLTRVNKTETFSKNSTSVLTRAKSRPKMPYASGGELFVDINSVPVENSLIDGVSKEDVDKVENEFMSYYTLAGVLCITAIILVFMGILRVYYCYNKVIWNPHGSLSSAESPPETPNTNIMRKMKALAAESEEVFKGKKKGLKEQPPSYEILFPLPEENTKDGLKV